LIPDFDLQLRFLRQFYNAFKIDPIIKHEKVTKATKSNILLAFERLIKNDVAFIFNEILEKAAYYSKVAGITSTQDPLFNKLIEELNRVGAASSHTLLMFLFSKKDYLEKSNTINEVVEFLIKYYLRRNVTDYPNTRDLDAINIEVIEKVNQKILNEGTIKSGDVISWHLNSFRGKPSTDQQFRISLSGSIYDSNVGMTRYLLWKIDSIYHTREYSPNLWNKTESGQYYLWTIEHIFPEGRNIPQSWINMIGNGDKEETEKIQTEYVHKLGNLTLSAYNSNLSNRSFQTKQNLEKKKLFCKKSFKNIFYLEIKIKRN
jgi:sulfur relay (sulfurtransferase) DsrC/TusE family protein